VRSVVRAAAYRPHGTEGDRRVAGPDEDRLTLLAAALEAAVGGPPDSRPCTVQVLGSSDAPGAEALSALLGREVALLAPGDASQGLGRAIAGALHRERPELIAAVRLSDEEVASSVRTAPDDAAVALLVDGSDGAAEASALSPETFGDDAPPVEAAFTAYRATARSSAPPGAWVGDWADAPRGNLPPRTLGSRPPELPPVRPSEGAYVPRARYLESVRSRWGFLGERCAACGRTTFPCGGRCRTCGRADRLETVRLPKDGGKVVARTWIGAGGQPTEFDPEVEASGAYGVVLVDLLPGIRATLMVADATPQDVAIGQTVSTRLRRLYAIDGEWRYGRKAVPGGPRPPGPGSRPSDRAPANLGTDK
jgi:uncharacterized OB-fold protein